MSVAVGKPCWFVGTLLINLVECLIWMNWDQSYSMVSIIDTASAVPISIEINSLLS